MHASKYKFQNVLFINTNCWLNLSDYQMIQLEHTVYMQIKKIKSDEWILYCVFYTDKNVVQFFFFSKISQETS